MKTDLIKSTNKLYFDIDNCITDIINARTKHDNEREKRALFWMEGLMVQTQQQLTCILDYLNDNKEMDAEPQVNNDSENHPSDSPTELEEEIKRYCREEYNCDYPKQLDDEKCWWGMPHIVETARHFAKWQRQQDEETIELAEDHAYFAGAESREREMTSKLEEMTEKLEELKSRMPHKIQVLDIMKSLHKLSYSPNIKLGSDEYEQIDLILDKVCFLLKCCVREENQPNIE